MTITHTDGNTFEFDDQMEAFYDPDNTDADDNDTSSRLLEEQELPLMEDRQCFLTCLACILVSSFKYDVIEAAPVEEEEEEGEDVMVDAIEEEDKEDNSDNNSSSNCNDGEEEEGQRSPPKQMRSMDSVPLSSDEELELDELNTTTESTMGSTTTHANNEVSMFMEDDNEQEDEKTSKKSNKNKANNNNANKNNSKGAIGGRWRRRFGRGRANSTNSNDGGQAQDEDSNIALSGGDDTSSLNNASTNSSIRRQQEQKQRRKRISKAQQKLQLAATRHCKRRYIVADQFLQSSCEHLLLDKDRSSALYQELKPRLESLKTPRVIPAGSSPVVVSRNPFNKRWNSGNRNISGTSGGATSGGSASGSGSDTDDSSSHNNGEDPDITATNNDQPPSSDAEPKTTTPTEEGEGETTDEKINVVEEPTNDKNNVVEEEEVISDEEAAKLARQKQLQQQYLKQHEWMTEYDAELKDHLPGLSPGAGYRCLCWLLFQHLLHANKRGYDARARYAFKSMAVAVLIQDIERTLAYDAAGNQEAYNDWKMKNYTTWVSFATRKFEQVETAMAERLLKLANQKTKNSDGGGVVVDEDDLYDEAAEEGAAVSLEDMEGAEDEVQVVTVKKNKKKLAGAKKHLVRGLKIGGVGVVAGTLLAVTGGMAAPAIAGALTFFGLGTMAGTFLTFASTTAVVHIFGVAGGSLAAYKMRTRTAGLTEFTIVQSLSTTTTKQQQQDDSISNTDGDLLPKEQHQQEQAKPRLARWRDKAKARVKNSRAKNQHQSAPDPQNGQALPTKAELSRTICISGWLTDKCDFQRPWGISPTNPPASKLENLQRFYRVYNPDLIPVCSNLLKRWKKEESTFYDLLEDKYGCNPDTLFPLRFGPRYDAALTEAEIHVLDSLIVEIGKARGKKKQEGHAHLPDHIQSTIANDSSRKSNGGIEHADSDDRSVVSGVSEISAAGEDKDDDPTPGHFKRQCYASVFEQVAPSSSIENLIPPAHLATVWDFSSRYGGEIYSLHWETHMLMKLCQCFKEVALSTAASAGQQALKLMVANTMAMAAAVPIYVVQAMNSIDETWSVVVSRAEEAGQELARSLLVNEAGHRPVTLLGYSFGARVVFSCLKQLLVYQQQWEEYHEQKNSRAIGFVHHDEQEGKSPSKKEKKWMLEELEFDREPASVVEDVVLMGAPMYLSLSSWKACRQVVAGRFVNVYSRSDKILSLMFKYKQMMESFKPVCGNCTVAVPGVENIDVSDLVGNHQEYVLKLGDILKRVRHGQPIRSSSNALDEVALIAEAETYVKEQKKPEAAKKKDGSPERRGSSLSDSKQST